ncbi:hypothetical protein [Streptomyces sp. NPDC013740]|uniref:hypothetical protein n=1 Tax=Streptomyces sp. NPDC013740 TaxID=3364867 RepID=UPI00370139C2
MPWPPEYWRPAAGSATRSGRSRSAGTSCRGYDATDPAGTAPHTDNVFTGRVKAFDGRREIDGWTQDVYQVEVASTLRGNLRGTVRVTYGLDEGATARLRDGATYVFAPPGPTSRRTATRICTGVR